MLDAVAVSVGATKWVPLVDAAMELRIPYGNAYDYLARGVLKGRKMKPRNRRRGWWVTMRSVDELRSRLDGARG